MSFPNLPLILTFDEDLMQRSPFEVIVPNSVSLTVINGKINDLDIFIVGNLIMAFLMILSIFYVRNQKRIVLINVNNININV